MKTLVTGGAGFIGSHLVEALVARSCTVRVFDNYSCGTPTRLARLGDAIHRIEGDVRDLVAVRAAVAGIEVVFHLAANVSVAQTVQAPIETFAVNFTGALNVLEAARDCGVRRVVFASTCAVYGDTPLLPARESDPVAPASPYAASKFAAEQACRLYTRLYGVETVVLRFFNVYGPGQDPAGPYAAVVPRFIEAFRSGRQPSIYGDGHQTRDFIFVSDITAGLWAAATMPDMAGVVYNMGCGGETSVLELATIIGTSLGVAVSPEFKPPREGEIRRSRADIAALSAAGFSPTVELREGIARTVGDT